MLKEVRYSKPTETKMFKKITLSMYAVLLAVFTVTSNSYAASAAEIDAGVGTALSTLKSEVGDAGSLISKAKGVLVFPSVYKAGIGIGGEYGEGALLINGKNEGYYSTAAASIGFQLGAQKKSIVILFMEENALKQFQGSSGWKAGVDASVALIKVGAGGSIDTTEANKPIIGFIIGQKGLMYNLTLEGAKFTRIYK